MLSSVLRSPHAVDVNIEIMRVRATQRDASVKPHLARELAALEQNYDAHFRVVFDPIRELMKPPDAGKRFIGFRLGKSN